MLIAEKILNRTWKNISDQLSAQKIEFLVTSISLEITAKLKLAQLDISIREYMSYLISVFVNISVPDISIRE